MSALDPGLERTAVAESASVDRVDQAGCRLELSESSDGWLLTVTLGADDLTPLLRPGRHSLPPGQVQVSIKPNLVPGEPFDLDAIQVVSGTDVGEPVTAGRDARPD